MNNDNTIIESLNHTETGNILPLLEFLAEHHNKVSTNFSGMYPLKPLEQVICEISQAVKNGYSKVDVVKKNNHIIGFSQYTIENNAGELKFLVVLPEHKNQGYGKLLIERALKYFEEQQVKRIDIRVLYGNDDAKRFYEKYGFKVASQIMSLNRDKND